MCFAFWAGVGRVDTKFLNLSHHFLSMDGWPGDATFFLWGQPSKIIRMYSPLELIFDTCASASSSHLFGWWSWTYVVADFCEGKCMFNKKHVFCILGARWHKMLEFVPPCPICGWLAWWCDFFPVGPTFEDHPHVFSQKSSSPLELIFDTCASASSSHLFGWWSWTYVVVAFCKDKCIFSKKHVFCILGARWHKILEFVPSCPICGWLAWWCDFFPVGPTFEDHPHVFSQKKVQPLGINFWHLRLGLFKSPFWLVKLNICGCSLLQGQMYVQQKTCVLHVRRALTQNSWICPIISYLWMVGLVMRLFPVGPTFEDHPHVFSLKKVQPLGIYFWHLRLGLFKSPFWLVKLNICGCSLLQGQMCVQQKNMCFAFWAGVDRVDTKFLNLFHHILSMDGWPGDATFFLWGQPLKIIRLDLIFDTCASTSSSNCFNVCENEHTYSYPFARTNVSSVKNTCFAIWACVDTFFGICSWCLTYAHSAL